MIFTGVYEVTEKEGKKIRVEWSNPTFAYIRKQVCRVLPAKTFFLTLHLSRLLSLPLLIFLAFFFISLQPHLLILHISLLLAFSLTFFLLFRFVFPLSLSPYDLLRHTTRFRFNNGNCKVALLISFCGWQSAETLLTESCRYPLPVLNFTLRT